MNHGNAATAFEQRLAIWELAQAGQTDRQIAQQLQLTPSVVRKWRRRAQHQGRAGLSTRLGRPARGALSHSPPAVAARVKALRQAYPGWGPLTLQAELGELPRPSRARIAAFLKAEGLTRSYERHAPLAQPVGRPPAAAHAEWEMDAQGVQLVAGAGRVVMINIGDPHSRLLTESLGCLHTSKASLPDYQLALRRAWMRFGLPAGLSLDHDSSFHDPTCASPYPTRLHLWLLALGVTVRFIGVGQPTQHGFIEHAHQVMTHQALTGQQFAQPQALQAQIEQRREFLNRDYPNRALGGQAPLHFDPSAHHTGRPYSPEREAELLDRQRVYAYLAPHRWFRRVTARGQFELGACRYGLGSHWGRQTVEVTFDPQTVEFICQSEDGQKSRRLPAKGLTPADWMGDLDLERLPSYQLAFPLTAFDCRMSLLLESIARYDFTRQCSP